MPSLLTRNAVRRALDRRWPFMLMPHRVTVSPWTAAAQQKQHDGHTRAETHQNFVRAHAASAVRSKKSTGDALQQWTDVLWCRTGLETSARACPSQHCRRTFTSSAAITHARVRTAPGPTREKNTTSHELQVHARGRPPPSSEGSSRTTQTVLQPSRPHGSTPDLHSCAVLVHRASTWMPALLKCACNC